MCYNENMKKNLENILFTLSENAEFSQISHEKFNGIQIDCKDGTFIKIYETLIPQEVSVQIVTPSYKNSIIVESKQLKVFLDYAHLNIEKDQAYGFLEDIGQKTYNIFKENALLLLSGKSSKVFSIKNEQDKQSNSFELSLHNNLNDTKASIVITYGQKVTSLNPLRVSVMGICNLLEDNQITSRFMHFYIPEQKIKNYPLIHFNILGHKNENEFINDLILNNQDSKLISYFNLNCNLEEKKIIPKCKI